MKRAGWLCLMMLCLACKEEAPELGACDRESCSDACTNLAGGSCDVRSVSCQERILSAVECVRGTPGSLPQVRLVTEEEYRAEQEEDAGTPELVGDGGVDAGADGGADAGLTPSSGESYYRALTMLGLYVPDPSDDYVDNVGGYYERASKSITIIDRGQAQDSEGAQVTMAHEFVHALQDGQLGLTQFYAAEGDTTDAALAAGCLVEGEATLYEELAWVLLSGLSVDVDYWDIALERRLKYARDRVGANQSAFDVLWLMRYGVGARFLRDAWLAGGNEAVRRLYDAPPNSTLYWMLGYDASLTSREPLQRSLACALAQPPSGFSSAWRDTLGAFTLYAYLNHQLAFYGVQPSALAWSLALGWRQDSLTVFENEAHEVAVSWRIRFVDEATAEEVQASLETLGDAAPRIDRRKDELEIRASDAATDLFKAWRATSPTACPVE